MISAKEYKNKLSKYFNSDECQVSASTHLEKINEALIQRSDEGEIVVFYNAGVASHCTITRIIDELHSLGYIVDVAAASGSRQLKIQPTY